MRTTMFLPAGSHSQRRRERRPRRLERTIRLETRHVHGNGHDAAFSPNPAGPAADGLNRSFPTLQTAKMLLSPGYVRRLARARCGCLSACGKFKRGLTRMYCFSGIYYS